MEQANKSKEHCLPEDKTKDESYADDQHSCWSKMLSKVANIQAFVGVISLYTLTYITMEMYLIPIITTLEKKFGFRSTQSGFLLSLRELASLGTVMLFSHLARDSHKPRFLAFMGILGALGGSLGAFPYLFSGKVYISFTQ